VHPQNLGNFWPATATLVVHVAPRRISPVESGGERYPAWLVNEIKHKRIYSISEGSSRDGLSGSELVSK
jgi:hypothetical protein